jgi:GntR family transcriptional regulator
MTATAEIGNDDRTDDANFAPRYHQVYQDLNLRIRSGRWLPGDCIPSEAELCKYYGVSRGTIQRAVRDLVEQGVLRRERGRATYVSAPKLEGSVLASYQQSIERPHDAGARVIRCDCVTPTKEIRKIMGLEAGQKVYELERLRFVRGVPLSLQLSFLPADLCPELEKCELGAKHLHDVLQSEYKVSFLRAEEFLEPVKPDEYVANLLNISTDHPVLFVERSSYLFDGRYGEFRRAYMRGDLYRFRIELR